MNTNKKNNTILFTIFGIVLVIVVGLLVFLQIVQKQLIIQQVVQALLQAKKLIIQQIINYMMQ